MKSVFTLALSLIMSTFLLPMSLNAAEIILIAGEGGTSSTGRWSYASAASMGLDGNLGRYASANGDNKTYTFAPVLPLNTNYQIEIYNSLGKVILKKIISNSKSYSFNISKFKKGMYFVHVNIDNQNFTRKIIKN